MNTDKLKVHDFWNAASCGEDLYLPTTSREGYEKQAQIRYDLEPYIFELARFRETKGQQVLEIGVGLGADHQMFAEAGAVLHGIDLTARAVEHTSTRLGALGLSSQLAVGDAESLDFADASFDVVYSWGVLHHSPDTAKAFTEVHRVLKPGGAARLMIYHKWSLVGLMLWVRYALLGLRPWLSLNKIYARHLESPGTKAYSIAQAKAMLSAFGAVNIRVVLTHGDLLESSAGQRHQGTLLSIARMIWPRHLIRHLLPGFGLFMLIEAKK